jgi:hypothetical protein
MKRLLLATTLLAAACTTTQPAPPADPQGASGLFDWTTRADPGELEAFAARLATHRDAPARLAALAGDRADLAHDLLLRVRDVSLRASLARALAVAPDGDLVAAEDDLAAAEAALARGEAPELPADPAWSPVQLARLDFLRLGAAWRAKQPTETLAARSRRSALRVGDWTLLQRLETLRSFGVGALAGPSLRDWWRELASAALERGRPLLALRHASQAREWSLAHAPALVPADALLMAHGALAAGRFDAALSAAETATDGPSLQGVGQALRGQALLRLGQQDDAIEAFELAEAAFVSAGDEAGAARQLLNQATAWLDAGEPARARQALARLAPGLVGGPHGAPLAAQRQILAALVGLVEGSLSALTAAEAVDQGLALASRHGAYAVWERYAELPARLRHTP